MAIPLICELVFVGSLLYLQEQSLNVARQEARAHQLSDSVHALMSSMMGVTMAVRGYSLAHLAESEESCRASFKSAYVALDKLKQEFAGDANALAVLSQSEEGTRAAESTLNDLRAKAFAGGSDMAELRRQGRHRLDEAAARMMSAELLRLAQQSDKSIDLTLQYRKQENVRSLMIALFFVSILISLLMALYFSKEIAGRINEVGRNATRFSMGQSLGPAIGGSDEIAHVDQVFRTMAEMLERAMLKQRAVLDNARDMICSIDRSLVVTAVNPACEILLGRPDVDILGRRIVTLIAEEYRNAFAKKLNSMIEGDRSEQITTQMINSAGQYIEVICSAHWSEEEKAFFCVFHDISSIREAERLRQEVVAMVTHDIRSPLTSVMNFEEMLESGSLGQLNERGARLLSLARRSTVSVALLVNDLLDSEKIREGQLKLASQPFAITECIERCAHTLAVWAMQQEVGLKIESCDAIVVGDEQRIGQVISNLLSNAIKFSDQNTTVLITAKIDGSWLLVSVKDQGAGIPESELAVVFERFRQGRSKKAHLGSGLGLSICKSLIELHGGKIWAESEVGKGSTFSFKIPAGQV